MTDHFAVSKSNSDLIKTNNACNNNLKEHLEVLTDTDTEVDITRGNYSNSTAIKILDDIAKSPTDSNVSCPSITNFQLQ